MFMNRERSSGRTIVPWIFGVLLVAVSVWRLHPLVVVPIGLALGVAWLVVKFADRLALWRRLFGNRSGSAQLTIGLAVVALVGCGGGVVVYFGLAQLSGDPCLSDWDISCSSATADRLSTVQAFLLPVIMLGWASATAAVILGPIVAVRSLCKRLSTHRRITLSNS